MKNQVKGFKKKTTSLENLPQRGKMGPTWEWRRKYKNNHKVEGKTVWFHVKRTLRNSIGKPFDEVFSIFCKKFPKSFQSGFLEEFENYEHYRNRYLRVIDFWYVDSNRLIQQQKAPVDKKGPYTFYSKDYKSEMRHNRYGKMEVYTGYIPSYDMWKYEKVVTSGHEIEVESKKDPLFRRLTYENISRNRKLDREKKLRDIEKAYSFIENAERERNLQWTLNNIAQQRHGMDETSFHGEQYHGRKGKKKNRWTMNQRSLAHFGEDIDE